MATPVKIERELKSAVRYNPSRLMGVEFPLDETLDSIAALLGAVEEIRYCAVINVQLLPPKVRAFTRMIEGYLQAMGSVAA